MLPSKCIQHSEWRDFTNHVALAASKRHHVLEKTFHLLSFANFNCFDTNRFQFGLGDEFCSGMLLHELKGFIHRLQESQRGSNNLKTLLQNVAKSSAKVRQSPAWAKTSQPVTKQPENLIIFQVSANKWALGKYAYHANRDACANLGLHCLSSVLYVQMQHEHHQDVSPAAIQQEQVKNHKAVHKAVWWRKEKESGSM